MDGRNITCVVKGDKRWGEEEEDLIRLRQQPRRGQSRQKESWSSSSSKE